MMSNLLMMSTLPAQMHVKLCTSLACHMCNSCRSVGQLISKYRHNSFPSSGKAGQLELEIGVQLDESSSPRVPNADVDPEDDGHKDAPTEIAVVDCI